MIEGGEGSKKASASFLKKRSKKLLFVVGDGTDGGSHERYGRSKPGSCKIPCEEQKFFGSFFQKRTSSLPSLASFLPSSTPQ
jgi:hypothetical protein